MSTTSSGPDRRRRCRFYDVWVLNALRERCRRHRAMDLAGVFVYESKNRAARAPSRWGGATIDMQWADQVQRPKLAVLQGLGSRT